MNEGTTPDWVSVGQYSSAPAAGIDSGLLDGMNIPNRVQHYPRTFEWYIWVPREFEKEAKEALQPVPISEAELTAQALKEPPPDDA
jgi:hypothetical protein